MLKNREYEIIKMLIKNDSPLVIKDLANKLDVSPRTIRYDLDKIEDWLEEKGLHLKRKQGVGVYFENKAKEKLSGILDMDIDYKKTYNPEERRQIILNELLASDKPKIIKEFEINLDVSEGTVINDLNYVEEWLNKRNLELLRKPNYGIEIRGCEDDWREAVFDFLEKTSSDDDVLNILNLFENKNKFPSFINSYSELLNLIDSKQVNFVKKTIRDAEKKLNYSFTDAAFSALVLHIIIGLQRIFKNKDINMNSKQLLVLKSKEEFDIAKNIVNKLKTVFDLEIPESEIGYITLHLLGAKFRRKGDIDFNNEKLLDGNLLNLTYKLVEIAGKVLNITLTDDQELIYGLALHLKTTLNRIKYNLNIENQLVEDIQERYPHIYRASKIAAGVIQTEIQGEISEKEVGFIAMHIGAAVERKNIKPIPEQRIKVALVCSSGIGTTQIMAERLKNEFPYLNIIDTYSYHEIVDNNFKKHEMDFIISTINLPEIDVDHINVNPLLKNEDIKNIEKIIKDINNKIHEEKNKKFEYNSLENKNSFVDIVEAIIDLLNNNYKLKNKKRLENKLYNLFEKHIKDNNKTNNYEDEIIQPELKDVLRSSLVKTRVKCKNWKEAVKKSGELLLQKKYITQNYIKKMIENIEKRGPYVVITPGVALVHAGPEQGAKKIGISLITLEIAVEFNHPQNDPVKIVVAFSSPDKNKHLKSLTKLINMLYDEEFMKKITTADNEQKVIKLIKRKKEDQENEKY